MDAKEKEEPEETEQDRRKQYRALRAKGVFDKEAMEKVWPTTTVGRDKNIQEKADEKEKKKASKQ
ncbi:MAG: hypothetical protein WC717_02215 [Candidatus Micrarchaeia archaeon]